MEPALDRTARVLAGLVMLLCALDLLTWFVGPGALGLLDPAEGTMKVNTALCALALAASVLVRRTPVVAVLVGTAGLVGLASFLEYVLHVRLGIDELLLRDLISENGPPGRMAPATALSLVVMSGARWALQRRAYRVVDLLLTVPMTVGGVALLGYLFRVEQLYTVVTYSTVALPTAVTVVLLGLALAFAVPRGVASWVAQDPGAGATLFRHILPVALVVLPLLALLPVFGMDAGLFGKHFGIAVLVAAMAIALVAVAAVAARRLDRLDSERLQAQAQLRQRNDQLRERRDLEWRRAEQLSRSLGEEQARFQRAIGKIDDLIWTVEIRPDGKIRPEFSSGDASGLLGGVRPDGENDSWAVPEMCHPQDRPLLAAFEDQVRAGVAAEVELRIVGYDGETRWAWLRGTPRRERKQLFCDGILTNVTEHHQMAEHREHLLQLEQEQVRKLVQLNQLREELLAVTGHELRTPLAVIRGYIELLLEDTDLTDVQRKHLEVVANRARQVGILVDDIFDLAKFSAGLESIDVQPVSLGDAVADVVEDHRPTADAADVAIEVDVSPVTVAADPVRLRQILDNLLSNAIKYSLPGGLISVTARCEGDTATIAVSDGGIGIPPGELEHVFDRMYRASSAKDRDIKGTGLGLSVTKALVEAHDGSISVVSRPGGGTEFTVAIPVQRGAAGSRGPAQSRV
jgi:signal transduction histidine kinase